MNRTINARIFGISAMVILFLTTGMSYGFASDNGQSGDDSQNQNQVQDQNQDQNQIQNERQSQVESQSQHNDQDEHNADDNGDVHSDNHHGHGDDQNESTSTPPTVNATSSLTVVVNVVNSGHGVKTPADFLVGVTGVNPSVASFQGSATGTVITLGNGSYMVKEATSTLVGYTASYSGDCSGEMTGGRSKTCTIMNTNPTPSALGCSVNGFYGAYFNLPKTLTGIEGPITGIVTGTTPFASPWFDAKYLSFERNDASSVFNQTANFFPVNDGLEGDPFYTAIHWTGYISVATSGMYTVNYGSDDDMWVYVNNQLVIDNGGIHAFSPLTKQIHLNQGSSKIDIYFAERHVVQSGIIFTVTGATLSPCAPTTVLPTLAITPTTLPNGTVGVGYSQLLTATGTASRPFTWSVASGTLPSGLSLNATSTNATTSISGTPNAIGTYQFVISVTNGATSTSAVYTVTIAAATTTCASNCGGGGGHQNDADIAITKTVDKTNPSSGDTVTYTITVSALGPATSSIVTAHDILPGGLSLNSATTSVGTYNMSTGNWAIGMLSPNATATLHIAATIDIRSAGQTITNTATVSELSSLVDNPSNNSSSISIAVQPTGCTSNCGGGGGGGGGGITVYPIIINVSSYASTTVGKTLTVPVTVNDQNGFQPVITSTSTGSATFTTSTMNIEWRPTAVETSTMTITASDPWTHTTKIITLESLTSGGGGNVLGASTSTIGEILGASTACGFYITHYIHLGHQNNFADVVRLQAFLNKWMALGLPITGFYGTKTAAAVNQFQIKYGTEVLAPWVPHGLANDHTPTQYVYKTTRRWINMLECPALGLPVPPLP